MVDISEIIKNSIDDNLKSFVNEITNKPDKDESEMEIQTRIYKTLMNYSALLLENYHHALKSELANHDIEI